MTTARTGLRLLALATAAALTLAACSSSSSDSPTPSGSVSASIPASASALPSASGTSSSASPTSSAGLACAAYFELDLLNSQYAGGAVANGNMTEAQVKADFARLLKDMTAQAKLAQADGTADDKLFKNAKRMKVEINALKKKQALKDMPKAVQVKFAKQSLRVQRACDRAGYPLPAENVTARTSAGLS
jgi:hypothetical protein